MEGVVEGGSRKLQVAAEDQVARPLRAPDRAHLEARDRRAGQPPGQREQMQHQVVRRQAKAIPNRRSRLGWKDAPHQTLGRGGPRSVPVLRRQARRDGGIRLKRIATHDSALPSCSASKTSSPRSCLPRKVGLRI